MHQRRETIRCAWEEKEVPPTEERMLYAHEREKESSLSEEEDFSGW